VKSLILPLFMAVTVSTGAELNLTPIVSDYVADGSTIHQLTFKDGERHIEYEPPADWTVTGGAAELTLKAKQNFAQAVITVTALPKPQRLDEAATHVLTDKVLAELPVGSQFVKVEEQTPNPVLVGGHDSFEVTVSYQLAGEKFVRSVLVANVAAAQLQFRLSAKKNDFPGLHHQFKASLFTWQWVDPKDESTDSTKSAAISGGQ